MVLVIKKVVWWILFLNSLVNSLVMPVGYLKGLEMCALTCFMRFLIVQIVNYNVFR